MGIAPCYPYETMAFISWARHHTFAARIVCFCFSFWFPPLLSLSLYISLCFSLCLCRSMYSFKRQISSFVSARFLWWLFPLSHCRTLFLLFMKCWWYTLHLHVLPLLFVSYEARKKISEMKEKRREERIKKPTIVFAWIRDKLLTTHSKYKLLGNYMTWN